MLAAADNQISAEYNSDVYTVNIRQQNRDWKVSISCKTSTNTNDETINLAPIAVVGNGGGGIFEIILGNQLEISTVGNGPGKTTGGKIPGGKMIPPMLLLRLTSGLKKRIQLLRT